MAWYPLIKTVMFAKFATGTKQTYARLMSASSEKVTLNAVKAEKNHF